MTPIEKDFQADLSKKEQDISYRELIGSLMYISTVTRPDITYATSYFSQFLGHPTEDCWIQAKRIIRYLKRTKDILLIFQNNKESDGSKLIAYSDADCRGDKIDRKSTSGSVVWHYQAKRLVN